MKKYLIFLNIIFSFIIFQPTSQLQSIPNIPYSLLLVAPHIFLYLQKATKEEIKKAALISIGLVGAKAAHSAYLKYKDVFSKKKKEEKPKKEETRDNNLQILEGLLRQKNKELQVKANGSLLDKLSNKLPNFGLSEYKHETLLFGSLFALLYIYKKIF